MTYTFTFDASACSGCKACQEACKDKNNLPVGVLWRRVIEVSGGEWIRQGEAWTSSVFAYNLSLACNHCVHPKCAGVCPTDAYVTRPDGIVYIDSSKCMGCGYCSWACPYSAPQYDPEQGQMTKCNFCFDNIDAGLPPACVAACPMRVLNFTEVNSEQSMVNGQKLWELPAIEHPFPLPDNSRTEPHLVVKPHLGMNNSLVKRIANREEIKPEKQKSENPLILFTLLVQMAVGGFWAAQWLFTPLWTLIEIDAWLLRLIPYLIVGACLGAGGLFSFAHLGSKRNAWRALNHLRKSWLSREILYAGLFSVGWLVSIAPLPWQVLTIARAVTSLLGFGLVYSMAQVYRLRIMLTWNSWRTMVGFFITAVVLGQLLMANILTYESQLTGINLPPVFIKWIGGITVALLAGELGLWLSKKHKVHEIVDRLRAGLIAVAIIGAGIMSIAPNQTWTWISLPILLIVMVEEIIGRWIFYEALHSKAI
jgi:DMSO reductase iron-sulfur subunit